MDIFFVFVEFACFKRVCVRFDWKIYRADWSVKFHSGQEKIEFCCNHDVYFTRFSQSHRFKKMIISTRLFKDKGLLTKNHPIADYDFCFLLVVANFRSLWFLLSFLSTTREGLLMVLCYQNQDIFLYPVQVTQ